MIYLIISINSQGSKPASTDNTTQEETSELDPPSEDEPANGSEEVEITDTYVLNDLNNKLKILSGTPKSEAKINEVIGFSAERDNPAYKLYSEILTPREKIALIFEALDASGGFQHPYSLNLTDNEIRDLWAQINPAYDFTNFDSGKDRSIVTETFAIEGKTVADKYYDVYGEELVKKAETEPLLCHKYGYNASKDIYFADWGGCGRVVSHLAQLYKEKFTKNDAIGKAYIYVRVGTLGYHRSFLDIDGYCVIYSDISTYENIHGITLEEYATCPYDLNPVFINSSNYQNFTPYRFVFEKSADGIYHFSKVEKL